MTAAIRKRATDPFEQISDGALLRDGGTGQTAASPPIKSPPSKPYRALTGRVQMLGPSWLRERSAWLRQINRCQALSKLQHKIASELELAVDRTPDARDAGYAVRSHQWFADQLGGTRGNVIDAIAGLESLGFIEVKRANRKGVPNRYALTFPSASNRWDFDDDALPF